MDWISLNPALCVMALALSAVVVVECAGAAWRGLAAAGIAGALVAAWPLVAATAKAVMAVIALHSMPVAGRVLDLIP